LSSCGACGAGLSGAVCAYCGTLTPTANTVSTVTLAPAAAPSEQTQTQTAPRQPAHNVAAGGAVCPQCGEANSTIKYSPAHILICSCFFPLGLLCLLAPIKRCTKCGYQYGPGAFLRSLSRSTIRPLVVTAIAAIVILTYSHTSRSATALPGSFAAVSSDLQAESASAFTPAVDFVKTYYRLSNERDFQMMYGMLSERMQRKNPFADYVKYYDFVQHIAVEATPGDTANAVNVRITTRYRENNGTVTQSVDEGRWLLDVENGGLRLNAEDVHQIK
jgi:hypothetical protein